MSIKIGINGFGRIGRLAFREAMKNTEIEIVGINDLLDVDHLAYLLKFDSVHGRFEGTVSTKNGNLIVDGKEIRITAEKNPEKLKWNEVGASVILECTGLFKDKQSASGHISAGAKRVVVSAPTKDTPMFVMGVNHLDATKDDVVVSNASCTTNCLAPVAKVINDNFGLVEGLMTTIHAATSSQFTVDSPSKKNYRIGRSAINNIIPTTTGAAKAVGKVIKEIDGRLTGMAFRVPTANVSVVDLTVRTEKPASYEDIKKAMKTAADGSMKGVLAYYEDEVVSQDFVSDTATSNFDANAGIALNDNFFKIVAWYDNEYSYSSKMVDLAMHIAKL
ncbi:MAG: type I glyceraldehyde-3-phosphate dehydrogenase [Bacteroidota bacterium]